MKQFQRNVVATLKGERPYTISIGGGTKMRRGKATKVTPKGGLEKV